MHLKRTGYCFGVLIYTITTITFPSVGRCEPSVHSSHPTAHPSLHNDGSSVVTTEGLPHPSEREGRERLQLDSRRGEESRRLPYFHNLENGDRTRSDTSGLTPKLTMASTSADKSFKNRNKPKRSDAPNEYCGKGKIEHVVPGAFYITGQLETSLHVGDQADSAASVQAQGGRERVRGQRLNGSEESWHRLHPVVQCGDDAMTLTVRRRRAVQLQLDRVNESSVPLSQLPPQCGFSVQTTLRDLSLMAQYDACHVTQEVDGYALPLLWRGTPVKMSCPAPQIQLQAGGPSSLCCSPLGMTVKVQGLHATEELRVNVRGKWTRLVELAELCGYTLDRRDAEIIIAAPFITCGVAVKDGNHTLSLQIGEQTFTLTCPVSPPEELPLTHQPVVNSPHHLTRGPAEHMPESLEPLPWAPPFYLAPPYYPHPTYRHKYPSPERRTAVNPPSPSSLTPDPTFGPQPLPAIDSQPDYRNHYSHLIPVRESYKHFGVHSSLSSADDTDDSGRAYPELPLQPSSHAFNPYYHYYHHPKIPLPGPPQDPDPGPEVPRELSLTNPNNPENPVFPTNLQQSEALRRINSHQFLQPEPKAASPPYTLPTSPPKASALYTPHLPQPYPYHSYYFPHIAWGEAERLAPLNPDTAAETNLSDNPNSKPSTVVHDGFNLNTDGDSQNLQKSRPEVKAELDDRKRLSAPVTPAVQPFLPPTPPPGPDAAAAPRPEQPSFPTPSPYHNPPPYPFYYHPYYRYYQMYYGPESLLGIDHRGSPTSSKEALDLEHLPPASSSPPQHPSYPYPQTSTPPTESAYDAHNDPLHPYYYYYYSPHNTREHQYDAVGRPGGEKAEERLDNEMKDQLKAEPFSASPRGLGPVSDFDCRVSLGCCSYPVKDCTMGQHFIFALPDSVVEPTVAPPAHPSELSHVSCTPQKLTSDRDIYTVPLDGCGVSKHAFGQTVVHLLEVHGIHSFQRDHSSELENSPVRLMVECSSSPGSPGEVKLHVMGQPPPPPVHSTPATVAVLLRIATDESFTSFHPEAHLPLSLLRGRPVYMEVSLLDPPEPGLVLLVHSCLAYSQAPYASWMLVYDGCPSRGDSEPLPSPRPDPHHIRRFTISGFLSLHSESPPYMAEGGYSHLEDPEKCALLQMVTALYAASAVSLTQWKHKRGTSPTRSQQ
ncbi:uncharacterized protein LOC116396305 isoform X4 [Anarrhichthys ocellatus]|uniref:uncharacterized protein LOC116396305 isoform X4 n=2 Tax=Anarrhichthys ocellatus TaxID=433405 RepID=UPI0012ECC7A9|nr:uncharacterized protein LOC116396305 isoform X4 [Anarrhichthys ocellatus]